MATSPAIELQVGERTIRISNPDRVYFPATGATKRDLAEYFWLVEQVTGTSTELQVKVSRSDLADSALHAPRAGFGDEDFYPDLLDKPAVLTCRLHTRSTRVGSATGCGLGSSSISRRKGWTANPHLTLVAPALDGINKEGI